MLCFALKTEAWSDSEVLVTADLEGLILGIDWLRNQDRFKWDFERGRIKFGNEEWIDLRRECEPTHPTRRFVQTRKSNLSNY